MLMTTPAISTEEFADRRQRAVAAANARGLDALLVVSRGGGTLDRYGDVLYLSNFYTSFPFIPDFAGNWSARAHTFLLLPVGNAPHLVIDVPDDGRIRLADGRVEYTDFVLESVIAGLSDAGLSAARIGLVGSDVLTFAMQAKLRQALPQLKVEMADDLVAALRRIKSPGEIAALRKASRIGSRMIEVMLDAAVPGASHGEVVAAGLGYLVPQGGILYNSFMASGTGGDPTRMRKTNFPTWASREPLRSGDWIRFGISGAVDGYMFDLARAKAVGPVSARQVALFEAAVDCVETTIGRIRPGITAGELGEAGLGRQQALGFNVDGVFSAMGHGLGLGWDDPWLARGVDTPIEKDMVLCVERGISDNGYLGDFEETVLVTDEGCERLTDARIRCW